MSPDLSKPREPTNRELSRDHVEIWQKLGTLDFKLDQILKILKGGSE